MEMEGTAAQNQFEARKPDSIETSFGDYDLINKNIILNTVVSNSVLADPKIQPDGTKPNPPCFQFQTAS